MDRLQLESFASQPVPIGAKGLPFSVIGMPLARIGTLGLNILDDSFVSPAAVLLDSALRHNAASMMAFTRRHDVKLAPHGKTTMSPHLLARQIKDGCWGLTAATPAHLALYRSMGVQRIIYANQLIDPAGLHFVVEQVAQDPFELLCIVDSMDGARRLQDAGAAVAGGDGLRIDILIEIGMPGGRTGLRSAHAASELAERIASDMPGLRIRGVEAFEGIVALDEAGRARVDALLEVVATTAAAIHPITPDSKPILSAGGSAFFPLVVERLRALPMDCEIILRSGCYLTHDHGLYEASQRSRQCHDHLHMTPPLQPALEVWARVQSRPEPDIAFLNIGKRDVSHDAGLPVPIKWVPRATRNIVHLDGAFAVTMLNDQHAYMRIPSDHPLAIGDQVAVGISHPCTTFDKWRHLCIVDDDYGVIEVVSTHF